MLHEQVQAGPRWQHNYHHSLPLHTWMLTSTMHSLFWHVQVSLSVYEFPSTVNWYESIKALADIVGLSRCFPSNIWCSTFLATYSLGLHSGTTAISSKHLQFTAIKAIIQCNEMNFMHVYWVCLTFNSFTKINVSTSCVSKSMLQLYVHFKKWEPWTCTLKF